MKTYIGIDNGITGSIGIISSDFSDVFFLPTPTNSYLQYTKKKQFVTRIDHRQLRLELSLILRGFDCNCLAILERPMINPTRHKASMSAIRSWEAILICLEMLTIPVEFIDSKQWQKQLLPSGLKGRSELKKASLDVGIRLFPQLRDLIKAQKDADGLLIAEWARRKNL